MKFTFVHAAAFVAIASTSMTVDIVKTNRGRKKEFATIVCRSQYFICLKADVTQ